MARLFNGTSSYQIAVDRGFVGTEDEWLVTLKGKDGKSAYEIAVSKGYNGTEAEWVISLKGLDGKSAYQVAVGKGFSGTEEEWLDSLKSDAIGKSAYQVAVENGFVGTEAEWLLSLKGSDASQSGKSAYEIAVEAGFVGTEVQWIASLKGKDGEPGAHGVDGTAGPAGETPRIDEETRRWFIGDHDTGYVAVPNIIDIPGIPVALSQLTNDTNFIDNTVNNLINYYKKDSVYSKDEVIDLLDTLSTIKILIVDALPTENISDSTIYLVEVGDNVYSQHLHTAGGWANMGDTGIDLHNYVTTSQLEAALLLKSNTNHTHSELHAHSNKAVLDTITQQLIQKWNNNFSGKYSDLTGVPLIPTVTNDLTNQLKSTYDQTVAAKHSHTNKSIIDKFSESEGGNPLYNNQPIYSDVNIADVIDDTSKSTVKTWSSDKVAKQVSIIDHINIAQKTINKRGMAELLLENSTYAIGPATTNGTSVLTMVNQTISLLNGIDNYDILNIQIGVKSSTRVFKSRINSLSTSQVVFNNTETYKNDDGSLLFLSFDLSTVIAGAYGVGSITLTGWFKTPTKFFVYSIANPFTDTDYNQFSIFSIEGIKIDSVTIDPVEYVNSEKGIEDAPVGHILNMMSLTTPKHYLKCDGTIYNIVDYPHLSQHIKEQFGAFNFFGGDGVATFAVPDLRGEFLRGTGTANRNTGTGASVGGHQDGTISPYIGNYNAGTSTQIMQYYSRTGANFASNSDMTYNDSIARAVVNGTIDTTTVGSASNFTSRPTNTSVLYCIKYEPTYFMSMEGFINEVTLWEGNVGTTSTTVVSNSIDLKDSYTNYNKIGVFFTCTRPDGSIRPQYKEIYSSQITTMREYTGSASYSISFTWAYATTADYTDIQKTSTPLKFNIQQSQSTINKVIGIRYRTSSNSSGDDTTYTDSEIRDYVEGILNGNQ